MIPRRGVSENPLTRSLLLWWLGYSTFVQTMAMTGSLALILFGFGFGALCTAFILDRQRRDPSVWARQR